MYFIYVDESGDPGPVDLSQPPHLQPSRHYILTGVVVPVKNWRNYLSLLVELRQHLKRRYGLLIRTELHGAELINPRGNGDYKMLKGRVTRVAVYRDVLQFIATRFSDAVIINVHLDKHNPKYASSPTQDIQDLAWNRLLTRFNMYLSRSCSGSYGVVFADETNEVKVRRLLRKWRVYNMVPSHFGGSYNSTLDQIVEDPVMRNSANSYFVQIADLVSHALYRKLYPKGGFKKYNVDKLFDEVDCRLLKVASRTDPQGIVHL